MARQTLDSSSHSSRLHLKCDGTRWRTGEEWRGNWRMRWVASTLHTTSEHGVSSITTADAHTPAASSRRDWHPRRFQWTRPFRRKTKSSFFACAITFQLASNYLYVYHLLYTSQDGNSYVLLIPANYSQGHNHQHTLVIQSEVYISYAVRSIH